jgi:hypothetical protein
VVLDVAQLEALFTRTFSIGLDVGRGREKVALVRLRLSKALLGASSPEHPHHCRPVWSMARRLDRHRGARVRPNQGVIPSSGRAFWLLLLKSWPCRPGGEFFTRSTYCAQTANTCPGSAYSEVFRFTLRASEARGEKGGRDAAQIRCA